jgi:hypothetical protein
MTQPATPSILDVEATAALAEPIRMNLGITACYARLAHAFLGWLPEGANWCAFGTWASKQAGRTIRKEDLSRLVARQLLSRITRRPALRELHQVVDIPDAKLVWVVGEVSQGLPGIDRASDALARGNRLVFSDIGGAFARFLTVAVPGGSDGVRAFENSLRPGPPPDGQDLLRRSFGNYIAAGAAGDVATRAQLVLLANVQLAVHEQTRVQPMIREAMDASLLDVADTRRRIIARLDEVIGTGSLGGHHSGAGERLLNAVADDLAEELRAAVRGIITERLMSIELPGGRVLRLGSDIGHVFPPHLATLTNRDLIALLVEFDAASGTAAGSGAADWSILRQRMRFIAGFFRAYQEDSSLFDPPFDQRQLDAIAAGEVPEHL